MNDSIRTGLKIMVERAVRPVRTALSRKRKMREELLAHVSSVFEEESARLGNEVDALARTGQRFGNAAELTTQLQASVPWNDKAAWYWENFFKKPGTSPLYRASRLALVTGAISFVLVSLGFLFGEPQPMIVMAFITTIFVVLSLSWFLFLPLIDWLQRRLFILPRWSWRKVAYLALASCMFLLPFWIIGQLITSVFHLGSSGPNPLPWLGLAAIITSVTFYYIARLANEESRHYQEWANLPIE